MSSLMPDDSILAKLRSDLDNLWSERNLAWHVFTEATNPSKKNLALAAARELENRLALIYSEGNRWRKIKTERGIESIFIGPVTALLLTLLTTGCACPAQHQSQPTQKFLHIVKCNEGTNQ